MFPKMFQCLSLRGRRAKPEMELVSATCNGATSDDDDEHVKLEVTINLHIPARSQTSPNYSTATS